MRASVRGPLLFLVGFCVSALGDVLIAPGSTPIEAVFRTSSLVCTCLVNSVDEDATTTLVDGKLTTHHEVMAHVEVRDTFKSDLITANDITVHYTFDEQQKVRIAGSHLFLQRGQTVLLFLAKNSSGLYEFADPFVGATHFSSIPAQERGSGLEKLQQVMTLMVKNSDAADQLSALRVLLGFDHVTSETVLAVMPLTESHNSQIALTAIGVQLRTKSLSSLNKLQKYLETYPSNTEPLALSVIDSELRGIDDPGALNVLESLSVSSSRSVRYGAMDGIRKIRDPKSISFLITKLDDPDSNAEYTALITIAEITGKDEGDFAPSMYLFDRNPQYYLALWRKWWVDEGRQLYPAPNHP